MLGVARADVDCASARLAGRLGSHSGSKLALNFGQNTAIRDFAGGDLTAYIRRGYSTGHPRSDMSTSFPSGSRTRVSAWKGLFSISDAAPRSLQRGFKASMSSTTKPK